MNTVILIFMLSSVSIEDFQGIHEIEWYAHRGEVIQVPAPKKIIPYQRIERPLNKVVYGYYPYWMGTSYNNLHYDLLSHIAYFSVGLHNDGSLGSIPNVSILENLRNIAHSNGVVVTITATQFNNDTIAAFLNSAAARTNGVNNLYNLVMNYSLDGVSIDFEMPTNSVKDSLTLFMQALTDYFHTNLPGSHISIATPAVDWNNSFDYDQLALHSDGLFIMCYDYYWSGSSYAGPVSPLYSSSLWGTYSVMWTVNNYIYYGIYRDKFILGCPYYGIRWPTQDGNLHSATRGNGTALTYTKAADSASVYGKLWEDTSKTVWYKNYITGDGWYQCWFDDSLSLRLKYQVVLDSSLAGAGIWALGYDGTKEELWGALRDAFYITGVKKAEKRRGMREARGELSISPDPFRDRLEIRFNVTEESEERKEGEKEKIDFNLRIYDLSGRLVKDFSSGIRHSALGFVVIWDGKDTFGKKVPSGVYLIRIGGISKSVLCIN